MLEGLKDGRVVVTGTDGDGMVVDGEGVEGADTDAAARAGVTVRVDGPEAVTVATTVVVMVVVKTAAWPVAVMGELGDGAGTSRAPATYTSVTFRACCEALAVGAVLVEVLDALAEPLVVELPVSRRTFAPTHGVELSEALSVADIGSIFPLEGS